MVRGGRGTTSFYRVNFTFGRFFIMFFLLPKLFFFPLFLFTLALFLGSLPKFKIQSFFPVLYIFLSIFSAHTVSRRNTSSLLCFCIFLPLWNTILNFFFHYFHHIYFFFMQQLIIAPLGLVF